MRPAIPAAPPAPRAPLRLICIVAAVLLFVAFSAVVSSDRECHRADACTVEGLLILALPLVVALIAAALIARVTRRIAMSARIWLSVAVAAGFAAGLMIGPAIEGENDALSLLAIPLVVLFVAPFPFVVISIVSWVFEAKGTIGRRRTPERPDVQG